MMDIKSHSTMIIALAIAVVIVTGVMVPVISDAIANGNGGGSGGGSGETSYTNEAIVYMNPAGVEDYQIQIAESNSSVAFSLDGTTLKTMQKGSESWSIPIFTATSTSNMGTSTVVAMVSYLNVNGTWGILFYALTITIQDGVISDIYAQQISHSNPGYTFDVNIFRGSVEVYLESDSLYYADDVILMLSDDSGSYVYTSSPVVAADTEIIQINNYYDYAEGSGSTPTENTILQGMSVGTLESLTADYEYAYQIIGFTNQSGLLVGSQVYRIDDVAYEYDLTATDLGTRINGVDVEITWTPDYGEIITPIQKSYTFTNFIVPKTVEKDNTPENGYWKLAGEESTNLYARTMGNKVALYNENPWNDDSVRPYFTISDLSTFVPILIGERFTAIVDSTSLGSDTYGASIFVYGDYNESGHFQGFATTSSIEIDGTQITFFDSRMYDGPDCVLDGLIAYLAPDGTYTSVTDSFKIDSDKQFWTGIQGGNYASIVIGGTVGSPEILNDSSYTSATYTTSSGKVTGVSVSGESEPFVPISAGVIQPITPTRDDAISDSFTYPMYTSDGYEPETFMFSIIPIEEESSGGGGSGGSMPQSLVAILSAVPIVVLAGLLFMGLKAFRMQ